VINSMVAIAAAVVLGALGAARGDLSGRVSDTSDRFLPGVTISLEREDGTLQLNSVTDSVGRYRFPAFTAGSYRVSFSLSGFDTRTVEVEISGGSSRTLDIVLTLVEPTDELLVSTCDPIIDIYAVGFELRRHPLERHDVRVVDEDARAVAWATFELSGREHLSLATALEARICFMSRSGQYTTFRISHPAFLSRSGEMCSLGAEQRLRAVRPTAPNKSLHRTPAAAPPLPVSFQTLGDGGEALQRWPAAHPVQVRERVTVSRERLLGSGLSSRRSEVLWQE